MAPLLKITVSPFMNCTDCSCDGVKVFMYKYGDRNTFDGFVLDNVFVSVRYPRWFFTYLLCHWLLKAYNKFASLSHDNIRLLWNVCMFGFSFIFRNRIMQAIVGAILVKHMQKPKRCLSESIMDTFWFRIMETPSLPGTPSIWYEMKSCVSSKATMGSISFTAIKSASM